MVARHIVKPDPIGIKIVENCQAEFIAFSVVRLRTLGTSSIGPVNIIVSLARGPLDVSIVNFSAGPEIPLPVFGNKPEKLLLLGGTVEADWSHVICSTEGLSFTLFEFGASYPPAYKEVFSLILVVRFLTTTSTSSPTASSFRSSVSVLVSIWSSVWPPILVLILVLSSIPESVVVVPVVVSILSHCSHRKHQHCPH